MRKLLAFFIAVFLVLPVTARAQDNAQGAERFYVELPYGTDFTDGQIIDLLEKIAPPPLSLTGALEAQEKDKPALAAKVVRFMISARKQTINDLHALLSGLYSRDLDIIYDAGQWSNNQRGLSDAGAEAGQMQQAALSMPAQANEIIDDEAQAIEEFLAESVQPEDQKAIADQVMDNEAALKTALLEMFKVRVYYFEGLRGLTNILMSRRDSYYIDNGRLYMMPNGDVKPNFLQLGTAINESRKAEKTALENLAGLYAAYAALCENLLQKGLEEPIPAEKPKSDVSGKSGKKVPADKAPTEDKD
jgi:hypothetical protein